MLTTLFHIKNTKLLRVKKKDWAKITKALSDSESELFSVSEDNPDYKDLLENFIFKASDDARSKLLEINALPLLKVLRTKDSKPGVEKYHPNLFRNEL